MNTDFIPDLDAYFARIGDDGPRTPTRATLDRIIAAHVRTIPFENLDILLGRGISVELEDIERKLVHARRGGYCFEQNSLMLHVLLALGFQAHAISARVRIQKPRDFTPPRTHQFLRVELEGEALMVDVGVGALSPTASLALVLDTPQPTPHETRRFVATGAWCGFESRAPNALLYHQVQLDGAWQDICEFTLEAMHPIDRELGNWFTSTHPCSHFKNRLMAARSTETGRMSLVNRELKLRDANGLATTRRLETDSELLEALAAEFGLEFPSGTRFDCEGLG